MRTYLKSRKIFILVVLSIVLAMLISSCELQQAGNMPSTPTMSLDIPILAAETEPPDEEAEAPVEEDTGAKEVEEETASDEAEEKPTPAPTETPKPKPTEKPAEDEAEASEAETEEEEAAEAEPTPTVIPYEKTSNNDPMVLVYGRTNCYESADLDSEVVGVAAGGSALGAFERDWNWYRVVHPTTGGLTCWITGDFIRPNQTAFNLGN